MEKEFVPYEQALALKELGFNKPCFGYWKSKNWLIQEKTRTDGYTHADQECSAPLYQQAFDFFREKYGIWQTVLQNTDIDWTYDILPINGIHDYKLIDVFEEYNEAKQACLKKLIEIVKSK
jgi:hypothetical protein